MNSESIRPRTRQPRAAPARPEDPGLHHGPLLPDAVRAELEAIGERFAVGYAVP